MHRYVEQMDKYYGNVCELDIILDELLLAGELQESSKKNVLRVIGAQDSLEDMEVSLSLSWARAEASARIHTITHPLITHTMPLQIDDDSVTKIG